MNLQKINSIILKLFFLFTFFVFVQLPSVFLGIDLAHREIFSSKVIAAQSFLKVFDLTDKHITVKDRITLVGEAPGASKIIVNNEEIGPDDDGLFRTGLVIAKGKNLLVVEARKEGLTEKHMMRILRLMYFPDIEKLGGSPAHWAKKDIVDLATLGVIEGYPDGRFEPRNEVSRGELATWIVRAKGIKTEKPEQDPFFDVPKEHWRAPYIREAALRRYMNGRSKDYFGIDDSLSRAAVAIIIGRAEGLANEGPVRKAFEDVALSDPSAAAIFRSFAAGYFIGVSAERKIFQPKRSMTRAEAVKVLSRMPAVKRLVAWLFDFEEGYDSSRLCRVNTEPKILWAKANPREVPRDGQTLTEVTVKVFDNQGLSDVSQVRIDLRAVGGPPDAIMYDNGTHGDLGAQDGVYSLQFPVDENADLGLKKMRVVVMDKSGWEKAGSVEIVVVKPW